MGGKTFFMRQQEAGMDDLKAQIVQRFREYADQYHVMETTHLALPFMEHHGHYPITEDAGYRRVLKACRELEKDGVLGSYSTAMNGRVWWLKENVVQTQKAPTP